MWDLGSNDRRYVSAILVEIFIPLRQEVMNTCRVSNDIHKIITFVVSKNHLLLIGIDESSHNILPGRDSSSIH